MAAPLPPGTSRDVATSTFTLPSTTSAGEAPGCCVPTERSNCPLPRTPPPAASPSLPPAVTPTPVSQRPSILAAGPLGAPGHHPSTFAPQCEKPAPPCSCPKGAPCPATGPQGSAPAQHAALQHGGTLSRARRDFTPKLMHPISSLCLQRVRDHQHMLVETSLQTYAHLCRDPAGIPTHTSSWAVPRTCPSPHALSKRGVTTRLGCSRGREELGSSILITSSLPAAGRGSLQGARPLAAALSSSLHCPRREGRSLAQSQAPLGFTQFDAGPGDGHRAAAMWTESAEGRTPSPQPARAALTSGTVLKA